MRDLAFLERPRVEPHCTTLGTHIRRELSDLLVIGHEPARRSIGGRVRQFPLRMARPMINHTDLMHLPIAFKALLCFKTIGQFFGHMALHKIRTVVETIMAERTALCLSKCNLAQAFKATNIITHGNSCAMVRHTYKQRASVTKLATKVGEISAGQVCGNLDCQSKP